MCSAHAGCDSAVFHYDNEGNGFLFGDQVVENQVRPALGWPGPPVLTHAVLKVQNGVAVLVFWSYPGGVYTKACRGFAARQ